MLNTFNRLTAGRVVPGAGRIRRFFRDGHQNSLSWGRTIDGLELALDPDSYIDSEIFKTGYFERTVLEWALWHLPTGGTFWDVGANFGLHALTVKRLRPDAKVFAFEPVPSMAARLIENARHNDLEITCLTVALGEAAGYADLHVKLTGNQGLSSITPWPDAKYDSIFLCRVEAADSLPLPAPNLVKIDVEGYEPYVLRGMTRILQSRPAIVFESTQEAFPEASEILKGYSIEALDAFNFGALDSPV